MTTRRGFLVAFILATVIPAVTIHAQGGEDRPNEGHWWCSSVKQEGPIYITGLWSGKHILAEVANSFEQEVLAKYAHKGRINCARANTGATPAQIQSGPSSQIAAWRSVGLKVVEIPWIYDPAKARLPHFCVAFGSVQKSGNFFYHNKILRIPGETQAQLTTAWRAHINERHPGAFFPSLGCSLISADPSEHQSHVDGYLQTYAQQKPKPQVIQLDWSHEVTVPAGSAAGRPYAAPVTAKPAGSATAPTTAPPPVAKPVGTPAAAPPTTTPSVQHAVCHGDRDPTARYFSAAFDGTKGDYADWMPAFQQFLEKTYKYRGFVRCTKQPSQAAAQKYLDDLISGARSALQPTGAKMKVVETGWTYK